jgi:2-desacetyl-2-hydroxyethyl bacteriochlorophyllide A dehydrogenase
MVKTKRIVFKKPREIVLEEADLPEPSENQVLIKTLVTLISTGTELTILTGEFPRGSYWSKYSTYPFIAGYSNVGIIIKKGDKVKDVDIGDRVASGAPHSQYALINVDDAVKVPENVSDEDATFHALASTVMNSVRLSKVTLGESVGVIGAGLLGQFAIMFSRLAGGFPVVAIEISEERLRIAKKSGATETIKSDKEDVSKRIKDLTEGRMLDVVFEVTGNPEVIPWAIKLVKPLGRFIILSSPRGPTQLDFHDEVNAPSRVIIGTHATSHPEYETPYNPWTRKRNKTLFFNFLKTGIVKVAHLITCIYPWYEAEKAYSMLIENRARAMGVLLDFRGQEK